MSDPVSKSAAPVDFVHLHNHTEYSLLDGACRCQALCEQAKKLNMSAVAMTDHGTMFATVEFYKTAKAVGVKPIIGCELYMAPGDRRLREGGDRGSNNHLLVLAKDLEGYHNLVRLCSEAYRSGFYYKPRIDMELLSAYHKGLVISSACLKGAVAENVVYEDLPKANAFIDDMISLVGRDHFFLEIMDHGIEKQAIANRGILKLAREHHLGLVATNDTHYLRKEDWSMHDVLLCIGTGKKLKDENRMRYSEHEFYFKSYEEMQAIFAETPEALSNTMRVAEMCNVEIPLTDSSDLYPSFHPPEGYTSESFLQRLCTEGLHRRYGATPSEAARKQMRYELEVIHKTGFDDYFLIVWDFINYAREHDIPVGPGRGSGAGSIVAYCLGITDLDPLAHRLIFERFLNIERLEPPDFDIDFCTDRRLEVVDYVRRKYGVENVCHIATFGALKAKNAIRDVGRVMDVPLDRVNMVCSMIPGDPKMTIDKAAKESAEFRDLIRNDEEIRALTGYARQVEGLHRNPGVHAAGVIITDKPVSEFAPIFCPTPSNPDEICCQFSMSDVTATGLLKMDFLGLKNLTVIQNACRMVLDRFDFEIDWANISRADEETYAFLRKGQTTGIFQLESSGMRDLIKKLGPTCFADVAAIIALYRPGPMENIPMFLERKKDPSKIQYPHSMLEEILNETYGVIVYQEQVMQIAQKMANFSMGQADILRKAMGKKKEALMREMQVLFMQGAADNGVTEQEAQAVWDLMAEFAKYGFNKAHTVAYAEVAFRTAYLKAHYPVEFMAALMTNDMGDTDKMAVLFAEARDMGVKIMPPDVNESQVDFTVVDGNIRFGMAAIKNVGEGAVRALIAEREANGPFTSFQNLCERTLDKGINSRMLEHMIKVGCFDSLGHGRAALMAALPQVLEAAQIAVGDKASGQMSLFDGLGDGSELAMGETAIPRVREWSEKEKLAFEKDLTGFFITGHPLDALAIDIRSFSDTNTKDFATEPHRKKVRLVGQIVDVRRITTKNGDPMAFIQIEDFEGQLEAVIFSRTYQEVEHLLIGGALVVIDGSVNERNGTKSLIVDRLRDAESARTSLAKFLDVIIPLGSITTETLGTLKQVLNRHTGSCRVRIIIKTSEGDVVVQSDNRFAVTPRNELLRDIDQLPFAKQLAMAEK